METEQDVVFLHGLGDGPDTWANHIADLPTGFRGVTVDIPGLRANDPNSENFTLSGAAADIVSQLDSRGIDCAHLCGHSLGAMIAFRIAVDHPDRVRSLTLAAGQVKPPRMLMAIQKAIMIVLPEKLVTPEGVSKAQMLTIVDSVAREDFSAELDSVATPTLVLCGSKDRANLRAARAFAQGIPDAELRMIDGAGHDLNNRAPERFSAFLIEFLKHQA